MKWTHHCPSCGREVGHLRMAYCDDCVREHPVRAKVLYRPPQTRLEGRRLVSEILPGTVKLMLLVGEVLLCVECGVRFSAGSEAPVYKHRCYTHPLLRSDRCALCKRVQYALDFPVVTRNGYNVRTVVCGTCCDSHEMLRVVQNLRGGQTRWASGAGSEG